MKKWICILLLVCMATTAAAESIDLSGMSYDELVALKERINLAIWNCQEWQEVTVPQGIWIVGKDIPAGKWTLTAEQTETGKTYIEYGAKLKENKNEIESRYLRDYVWISSKVNKYLKDNDVTEYTVDLRDGDFFIVGPSYGPVVFHTYSGEPSFTFN